MTKPADAPSTAAKESAAEAAQTMLANNRGTRNDRNAVRNGSMTAAIRSATMSTRATAQTPANDKAKASIAAPAPMKVMRETSRN